MAARIIEKRPKQITLIAPLTAFLFCIGSGTGNIIYPLLPVIYDVSYKNRIRPSRPLTVTVVQSGIALAASPVSAAMAAMLTLTDVAPYDLGLGQILAITLPACVIGIVVTSLVVDRMWKDLDDDPDVQAKIASGEAGPARGRRCRWRAAAASSPTRHEGRNSALAFLLGVVAIVVFGLFPDLGLVGGRRRDRVGDMTSTIVLIMFVVGVIILFLGRPDVQTVPDQSVFKAGMISAIACRDRVADSHLHRRPRGVHHLHHRGVGHELGVHLRPGGVPRRGTHDQSVHGHPDHRADRARRRPPGRRGRRHVGRCPRRCLHPPRQRHADRRGELRRNGHHEAGPSCSTTASSSPCSCCRRRRSRSAP